MERLLTRSRVCREESCLEPRVIADTQPGIVGVMSPNTAASAADNYTTTTGAELQEHATNDVGVVLGDILFVLRIRDREGLRNVVQTQCILQPLEIGLVGILWCVYVFLERSKPSSADDSQDIDNRIK